MKSRRIDIHSPEFQAHQEQLKCESEPNSEKFLKESKEASELLKTEIHEAIRAAITDPDFDLFGLPEVNKLENDSIRWMNAVDKALERLQKVVDSLSVQVVIPSDKELIGGDAVYDSFTNTIYVSKKVSGLELVETLVHETLHALSGKTLSQKPGVAGVVHKRLGLAFELGNEPKTGKSREGRFIWLDEGFTEYSSSQIVERAQFEEEWGEEYKVSYAEEQDLLIALMEWTETYGNGRLAEDLLARAYFEHYNEDNNPDTQNVPHWKELQKVCNDEFGPKFLLKLDFYINDQEGDRVAEAYRACKNLGADFPAFIADYYKRQKEEVKLKKKKKASDQSAPQVAST